MKKFTALLSFILVLFFIFYSFYSLMPQKGTDASTSETQFSTQRALVHLKEISKKPHYYGSQAHGEVRDYIISELKKLGAETEVQEGFVCDLWTYETSKNDSIISYPGGYHLIKPKNIVARIKGTNNTKSLVLLSHYDSAMVPSYGASDAGSGVVTILESLRAYLANGQQPKNDIIILFSDAEEIGLDGASLFVNEHRWAKDAGLVLNFEARGSGGPSNMILETNQGNANLIKEFIAANPKYPVASSLMYSIYKMLPNDTDSTVFREDGDIDSFFFAFIDDHFDYHTANDNYENLDEETLQHQGSYLLPLLNYFASSNLENLKAEEDYVYVNAPFVKMISYPFSWILWMLLIAIVGFLGLLFYGVSKRKLKGRTIARGFAAFLTPLIVSGLIGFFGWKLLLWMYPGYNEIQHGFTYNGHLYIAFFVLLTLAILLKVYKKFGKNDAVAGLYVAPLLFWILINVVVFIIIKGAAYFIIPVLFGLVSFWLLIKQEKPNILLLTLLASPAIFLFSPLIQFFPVGLGLEMLVISCVFTVLTFGLLLPVVGSYRWKNILAALCFIAAIVFFITAHVKSDFSEKRQKPNSLVYYQNQETNESYWLTYDKILDDWTKGYLGESPEKASKYISNVAGSKYNTSYTYAAKAPQKDIASFTVSLLKDTIINGNKNVSFTITPQRNLQRLGVYVDENIVFKNLLMNGKTDGPDKDVVNLQDKRINNSLVRYYITDNNPLTLEYTIDANHPPVVFTVLEYSYDLLSNPKFSINSRAKNMMPKPFVVTDAIIVKKSFVSDSIPKVVKDSITSNASKLSFSALN
jgi:hypothetical protein